MTTQKPLLKNEQLRKLAQALKGKSKIPKTDMNEIVQFLFPLLEGPIEQKMELIGYWDDSEKRQFRDAVVSILDQKIKFSNRVEKLGMKQGSYVKIRSDSEYANQSNDIGIMQGDFGSKGTNERGAWAAVIFYNSYNILLPPQYNYHNQYRNSDLRHATINEVLDVLSRRSFSEFKQVLLGLLQKTIEADCIISIRNEYYRRFDDGEKIIMNAKANEEYGTSKEGSEGTVLRYNGGGKYMVEFTKLTRTTAVKMPMSFVVHEKYMERINPRFREGEEIIINSVASKEYRYSKEGDRGRILSYDSNKRYTVEFTKLTSNEQKVPQTFDNIRENSMEKVPLNFLASEIGGSEIFAQKLMHENTDMAFAEVLSLRMAEELVAKQILERLDNGFFKINQPMLKKLITEQSEEDLKPGQDSASDKRIQINRDNGSVVSIKYILGESVIEYSLLLNVFLTITEEIKRESTTEEIDRFKKELAKRIKVNDPEAKFLGIIMDMNPQLHVQQQLIL